MTKAEDKAADAKQDKATKADEAHGKTELLGGLPDLTGTVKPEVPDVVKPPAAPVETVSSIDPAAPAGGGHIRKPKDWEAPHVHTPVVQFTFVKIEPDIEGWVVHVGFSNEEEAKRFYTAFDAHVKKPAPPAAEPLTL